MDYPGTIPMVLILFTRMRDMETFPKQVATIAIQMAGSMTIMVLDILITYTM